MLPEPITAGARTVAHLATYFDELKHTALELRERFGARDRGYFTPGEEEETRHLLVSYWQARNALYDLVLSLRREADGRAAQGRAAFLVGFAGAVLLVDAARFLRETFDDSPVVRAKLNEPDPHFGIPTGVYDTVQQSLTDPRHAWDLYQGMKLYRARESVFREQATEASLAPVLAVIDRLGPRIDVPPGRYLLARFWVRVRQMLTGLRRDAIGRAMYAIQEAASRMVSDLSTDPCHEPALPADVGEAIRAMARPGDVFITRKEHVLTNYFLPGYWPHAALYLGDAAALEKMGIREHENVRPRWSQLVSVAPGEPGRVLEALKDGVRIRSLASPLANDALVVLRPQLSAADVASALARGMFHEGKPYDFDFDFTRSDRLVCTEVVYRSYDGVGGIRFSLTPRAGRMTLAAEDLLQMAQNRTHFEPVAAFAPAHAPRLVTGQAVDELLRAVRSGLVGSRERSAE